MSPSETPPSSAPAPASVGKPVTVSTLKAMKQRGERITMLTAYDFPTARWLDESGIDVLLVGDSLGMVVQGKTTTVPVSVRDMIYHGEMVARAARRAMVMVDLPFPHGQLGPRATLRVAARIMKRTLCQAIKLEGGAEQAETIATLVNAGIPVMAHVGLRPQSVHALGGYKVMRDAERVLHDAKCAEQAGAFGILVECVPSDLARRLSSEVKVPTIGIGAGPHCDGQVLVTHDMLGLTSGYVPKFVRPWANLGRDMKQAFTAYRDSVQAGTFPDAGESFQ
ncbi:MAG: 3-methyl-2-oxobutanoate hydroxymethyltransferase [Pirellulaceae bacterium]|nr:3-methyl-2-oxobutanoate hydroxymethyltransferase [Pirellulaceae bacterium]